MSLFATHGGEDRISASAMRDAVNLDNHRIITAWKTVVRIKGTLTAHFSTVLFEVVATHAALNGIPTIAPQFRTMWRRVRHLRIIIS